MAETNVLIDGKVYSIACDDGQESRVQNLGRFVDQRMREIAGNSGNKAQAMVLTSLMLADEIHDLREHLQQVANNNEQLKREKSKPAVQNITYQGLDEKEEKQIMDMIGKLSSKVETLTKRVQKL